MESLTTLLQHPANLWLIAGAVLICIEVFTVPGVGFLFAGLAGLAVGVAIQANIVSETSFLAQFAVFLLLSAAWAAVLWRPLQRFLKRPSGGKPYQNIVGGQATVTAEVTKTAKGKVRWSATEMQALLDPACPQERLPPGTLTVITGVEGNILTVTLPA